MAEKIYISHPLTSQKIVEILDENPDLKTIKCPPSIYKRISPKYMDALSKLGIEVKPEHKKGRPKKYEESDQKTIQNMLKEGFNPQEIADTLQIPIKTVYYLKKTRLNRGRKRKYTDETEKKVKNLYKRGTSAQDISERLKIPLRTVYSLIKR